MKTFKRTNWTTEEVIELLKGQKLVPCGLSNEFVDSHNQGIDNCIELFGDFLRSQDDYGAMAYVVEDKEVVHIGPILPQ